MEVKVYFDEKGVMHIENSKELSAWQLISLFEIAKATVIERISNQSKEDKDKETPTMNTFGTEQ